MSPTAQKAKVKPLYTTGSHRLASPSPLILPFLHRRMAEEYTNTP